MPDHDLPHGLQSFNGYRKLNSGLIPLSLYELPGTTELTWFDLAVYGYLRYKACNSDYCDVALSEIARKLHVSLDSVSRSLDRLAGFGLVFRRRLQHKSRVIFLKSQLLNGSLQKGGSESAILRSEKSSSDSAAVRSVEGEPESAILRSLNVSESAKLRPQSPQSCGSESAILRSAYKEYSGVLSGVKEEEQAAAAEDTARKVQESATEMPPAATPIFHSESPPENAELFVAVSEALRGSGVKVLDGHVAKILDAGTRHGASVGQLVEFLNERIQKRKPELSTLVLRITEQDLPEWLAGPGKRRGSEIDESLKPKCPECAGVGDRTNGSKANDRRNDGGTPVRCSCGAGQAHRADFKLIEQCPQCRATLGYQIGVKGPLRCAGCSELSPLNATQSEIATALESLNAKPGIPHGQQDCRLCARSGILKRNENTTAVTVEFCACPHGDAERAQRSDGWPSEHTAYLQTIEREIAAMDAKFAALAPGRPETVTNARKAS